MPKNNILNDYIYPIAIFCGGMIGVGFLSLPYIAVHVGVWTMLFYFAIATCIVICLHLIFCEISLKTPDYKRFPGFVGYYLGRKAKIAEIVLLIVSSIGGFLAFLIVSGQFLSAVFSPVLGGSAVSYTIIFFFFATGKTILLHI